MTGSKKVIEDYTAVLARIDERLKDIKDGNTGDIPEIRYHLEKMNGSISLCLEKCAELQKETYGNKQSLKNVWRIVIGIVSFIVVMISTIITYGSSLSNAIRLLGE